MKREVMLLAVVMAVVAVGGMAATTLQEREESRASEAEARVAVASAREEALASERRAEEFLLRSATEPPTLEGLRHDEREAAEELDEREAHEREWSSRHGAALREGEDAAVAEADYIRALVGEARAEHERAASRVRALEAHEEMLTASGGSGS